MKFTKLLTAALLAFLAQANSAMAGEVPLAFSHHGLIYDGDELASGEHTIRARLYDDTNEVIGEVEETKTIENGYYSLTISSLDMTKLLATSKITLGLKVDNKPEMTPRVEVTSVPYAILAKYAHSVECEGCIDEEHLS